ncbi:protein of unknown function [Azospirillum baldaniorum]|uniref:Secreted protein n=1 Tax=Azospirillum baldaniorum TaxID=1064539 RepID=A0A9P1JT13_9PROT|nr:protein of unknown function [Azospirillum baldaniorum]
MILRVFVICRKLCAAALRAAHPISALLILSDKAHHLSLEGGVLIARTLLSQVRRCRQKVRAGYLYGYGYLYSVDKLSDCIRAT